MGEKEEVSQGDLLVVKRAMRWARWWIPILATLIPSCMVIGQSCGVSALKTTIQQESAKALNKEAMGAIQSAVRAVVREEIRHLERRIERLEDRQSKP